MDALSMAAPSSTTRGSDRLTFDEHELRPAGRIRTALATLSEAYDYAHDLDANPWDFAIEIANLRRLHLTNSDLRWLVGRGYIEHGIEVTVGGDGERTFQHPSRLMCSKRTCFVLTPLGAAWLHDSTLVDDVSANRAEPFAAVELPGPPALAIAAPPPPRWDCNRQELRVGTSVVRRFKIPSACEETILAAFEETHWGARIDDPLPPAGDAASKWRLQQTVEALNRQQRPPLIRFYCDAAASGVMWEFLRVDFASRA